MFEWFRAARRSVEFQSAVGQTWYDKQICQVWWILLRPQPKRQAALPWSLRRVRFMRQMPTTSTTEGVQFQL